MPITEMPPERWRQISAIYQEAAARTGTDRDAYLTRVCDGNSELRREVESLLAQGESFLGVPVTVPPGSRIGAYDVLEVIGAGGMGIVYRARDLKLQRDVALKVLPDAVALDPDRIARFRREAPVLASLNHPNIAAIYGFDDSGDVHALVLELVDGQTLAERIAHGPVPLDEALPIARQIAEALEAAHEQSIIHRDLKPANIKLRPDGTVKVLDFGLAKAMELPAVASQKARAASLSPTITSPAVMSGVGVLLGTAAYMSPEQAKGKVADKRSDIWAFGCVLYEMLSGQRTFGGEDVSDTLAHVLMKEPDWALLPADTPAPIRKLVARCLKKDRKLRLDSAAAARLEIDEALAGPPDLAAPPVSAAVTPRSLSRQAAMLAATTLIGAALVGYATWHLKPVPSMPVVRLAVPLGSERFITVGRRGLAVSPDGQQVVYVGDRRLHLRKFSQSESTVIKGTDNAAATVTNPVFSPDGQSLAFYTGGAIKKVALTGGTATTVCPAPTVVAMSWGPSGIVFSEGGRIKKVAPTGGEPELLLQLTQGIATDVELLPGGRTLLFAIAADTAGERSRIEVQPLPSGEPKVVVEDGSDPRYLSTGHLIFARGGVLFAASFDMQRLELSAEPVAVLDGVWRGAANLGIGAAQFAVSSSGTLAYLPGPHRSRLLSAD